MRNTEFFSRFLVTIVCLLSFTMGCRPSGEEAKVQVEPRPSPARHGIAEGEARVVRSPSSEEQRAEVEPQQKTPGDILLALKFSEGDSTAYKVTTEAQRNIKGEGALLDDGKFKGGTTSNRAELTFTQQIQSVDAQGNAVAKITIDKLKYLAGVRDNITVNFDSSRKRDQNSSLYKLIGQSYTIEITPEGEVSKIIDCNQAQASVRGGSSANKDALMLLKPEAIKLRHTIPAMPVTGEHQLRPGDNWNNLKPFNFGMMGSKSYERIYTLKKVEDVDNRRIALVQMSAIPSAETSGEQQEQAMGIFSKMFDNTEEYTGELKLDLNSGKVKEYFEKLQSEWIAVDPAAGPETQGQPATLRMTAINFYHIELVRAEPDEVRKID